MNKTLLYFLILQDINTITFDHKYKTFFESYNKIGAFINIKILENQDHNFEILDWAGELTQTITNSSKAIQIEKIMYSVKLKDLVFKKQNGSALDQILLIWNVTILLSFLQTNSKAIIPKARDRYFLFFLSPHACINYDQIKIVLSQIWLDFGVVESVAFTPSCSNHSIIYRPFVKNGDSWGLAKNYTIEELAINPSIILNNLKNFNSYKFNVSLFSKPPSVVPYVPKMLKTNPIYKNISASYGYVGRDVCLLKVLSNILNFQPIIVSNETALNYGGIRQNGTFYGSYKDVVTGKSLFAVNARYLLSFFTEHTDLSVPFNFIKVCAVAPKSLKMSKGLFSHHNFDRATIICIFITLAGSVTFWYFIHNSFDSALEKTFCFTMGYPRRMPPSIKNFFYMTACFTFNNVILVVLLGHLYKNLTTIRYEKDINTLEELLDAKLPILTYFWHYFTPESDSLWKKLSQRKLNLKGYNPPDWYSIAAYNRSAAIIDILPEIDSALKLTYIDEKGQPLLHRVEECIASTFSIIILQKGSAFDKALNPVIQALSEAGIMEKWNQDVVNAFFIEKIMNSTTKILNSQTLKLEDFKTSFYIFGNGCVFSIMLFICETIFKILKTRKPMYIKKHTNAKKH